jgi:hypothetical protein
MKLKLHLFDLLYNKLHNKAITNPQQIHNFSTVHNETTTSRYVKTLWICCGLNNKSTTGRKAIQQIHDFSTSHTTCCTTNPQQIHNKSNKWSLALMKTTHDINRPHIGHSRRMYYFYCCTWLRLTTLLIKTYYYYYYYYCTTVIECLLS